MKRKCALVTGGSRGIGRAICIQLAKDFDYHILVNFNSNEKEANITLREIKQNGGSGELISFDVTNSEQVTATLENWQKNNETALIEILINNAGITKDGLFLWMKPSEWHDVINVSLHGFFNVTNSLIKNMLLNKYGRIVNIVSVSGSKGVAGQTNYSAAKGAVIAATKSLAQEVAKKNITVNAVAPGFISSDMTSDFDEKELKKMIPINRFGKPEEVAHLVSFLVSEKASYITGEVININGGIS
ncbi:MAG: 3-oxoacyl-ACP reductase FabG [Gelidibacter sp.]